MTLHHLGKVLSILDISSVERQSFAILFLRFLPLLVCRRQAFKQSLEIHLLLIFKIRDSSRTTLSGELLVDCVEVIYRDEY
jgi:hypothetical protein